MSHYNGENVIGKYPHLELWIEYSLGCKPESGYKNESQSGFYDKGMLILFPQSTLLCVLTITDCMNSSFHSLAPGWT